MRQESQDQAAVPDQQADWALPESRVLRAAMVILGLLALLVLAVLLVLWGYPAPPG